MKKTLVLSLATATLMSTMLAGTASAATVSSSKQAYTTVKNKPSAVLSPLTIAKDPYNYDKYISQAPQADNLEDGFATATTKTIQFAVNKANTDKLGANYFCVAVPEGDGLAYYYGKIDPQGNVKIDFPGNGIGVFTYALVFATDKEGSTNSLATTFIFSSY
ncbi:hypothetical protein GKC32_00600 [Lactobacillus curvatus]|nr:hypothetical protein [Latilactobacillus curvatus]MSE22974.1 hypothetical protein [Latilactobacillus curvatus]